MVDRKPTYKNRVLVTKEADGTQEYVTWEHADSPITEGTPLNKQNLMSDEAAAALGLSADATPSKAFEAIGASLRSQNVDAGKLKFVILKLEADGWSGSAPYTQTMSISGMTEDWVPGVPSYIPITNSDGSVDVSATANALENVAYIKILVSGNGTLTAICPEDKPTCGIWLRVPGMVERS
nr:MAG TPA: hypothetical protein [Caudoviricetes sp.]